MAKITTAHSMSLDGFIAGPDGGAAAAGLHDWLTAGDTPSRANPGFTMARPNAEFFDEGVSRCGAVIAGRRTYDLARAWGGRGPIPGLPLFVVTHRVPGTVPPGQPPYTFVTTGIQDAAAQAATAAAGRDVVLMGSSSAWRLATSWSSAWCPRCSATGPGAGQSRTRKRRTDPDRRR